MTQTLTVIGWVLAPVCSAMVVALVNSRRELRAAREATAAEEDEYKKLVSKAMKTLLRRELVDAYRDHVTNGVPLTVERFHEISDVHDAYNGFHGNGTGDAMFDAIREKQIHIVQGG